jgi:regulatory subunit for Cdc7p protein kinase
MAAVATATATRRPMMTRPLPQSLSAISLPLTVSRKVSGSKRPHSPDPVVEPSVIQSQTKRAKAVEPTLTEDERLAKEHRRAERALQKAEFREKYTKAFPQWNFYFDLDHWDQEATAKHEVFKAKICDLGSVSLRESVPHSF